MKKFNELVAESAKHVEELFPWDLEEQLQNNPDTLILDVREPYEFDAMHIKGSLNVPRGVLETACEYDYEETVPDLVEARDRDVVVVCRSGNRSIFACEVMQRMGYKKVMSLKTGLRGWSDYEQPFYDNQGDEVDEDEVMDFFNSKVKPEQMSKK